MRPKGGHMGGKPKNSTPPKKGERARVGHRMGGLFGVTPKKSEPDNTPPTRAAQKAKRARRMSRLDGKLI